MKMLDYVDGLAGVAGVVALPLYRDSADSWNARWRPAIAGGAPGAVADAAADAAPAPLITDPTVERALLALTREVNLADGLAIRYAREQARMTFRILRIYGHRQDPARIKDWAITQGWRLNDAVALADLASRILGQKSKPTLPHGLDPRRRYAWWNTPSS